MTQFDSIPHLATPRKAKKIFKKSNSQSKKPLPLPKGNSPYALGKRAEYTKDLELAKSYFLEAIRMNDRAESAAKDYSSILHQQHRTTEACVFLQQFKHLFSDPQKFANLYDNLSRQIQPTGNSLNMILQVSPIADSQSVQDIANLFKNSSRIQKIELWPESARIYFASHSAARKTVEGFLDWNNYCVYWVSADGVIQGQAGHGYTMMKKFRPCGVSPDEFEVTDLPSLSRGPSENTAKNLIGSSLFDIIY